MKKRIFAFSLVFMLCFVNVHQVYADAGSLVIGGSAIAGIGAGVIAGPTVVAVFCAMMAFGMNIELTEASQEAGMTKTEFLKNKIQEYCNEAQISANTFNNYILDQANVFQDGTISITNKAGNLIQKFCNWLFESDQVNSESYSGTSVSILGESCPVINMGDTGNFVTYNYNNAGIRFYYKYADGNIPMVIFSCNHSGNYTEFYAITKQHVQTGDVVMQVYEESRLRNTINHGSQIGDFYCMGLYNTNDRYFEYNQSIPCFEGYTLAQVLSNISSWPIPDTIVSGDSITGDQSIYDTSKEVLNPTQDQTIVINPHITIPVPTDKDVTIDVNEYIDIIQGLIDGVTDDIITAIDDSTGVPIVIEWDPTQDWDPTIEKEDDTELPDDEDKTPVVDDDTIPSDFDVDPLKFDLKGFFPFCLPFDVADMIGMLQADPVAPSYTVDWDLPFIDQNLTFTVDLQPYDSVAETCRKMEILLFCVGLAVVTRSIFIRS